MLAFMLCLLPKLLKLFDEKLIKLSYICLSYRLGGPDPLDYISMYFNKGDPERNIPEHWHYVTFGFSDLHGDGRVHP